MFNLSCFSCLGKSVCLSIVDVWAGEAAMSGVATDGMCWQGAWGCCRCLRVSHERGGHESLVNDGKRRQVLLKRCFLSVRWIAKWVVSCGVCHGCQVRLDYSIGNCKRDSVTCISSGWFILF